MMSLVSLLFIDVSMVTGLKTNKHWSLPHGVFVTTRGVESVIIQDECPERPVFG